jgi:hypothetical protein
MLFCRQRHALCESNRDTHGNAPDDPAVGSVRWWLLFDGASPVRGRSRQASCPRWSRAGLISPKTGSGGVETATSNLRSFVHIDCTYLLLAFTLHAAALRDRIHAFTHRTGGGQFQCTPQFAGIDPPISPPWPLPRWQDDETQA